jgi:hypothetical protein
LLKTLIYNRVKEINIRILHYILSHILPVYYHTRRAGLAENNSKIECQNFRNIIFFKKKLTLGKKNVGKYSKNKHLLNFIFSKEINCLADGCRPCPTGTVYSTSYALFIVFFIYLYLFYNYSYKQSYYLLLLMLLLS